MFCPGYPLLSPDHGECDTAEMTTTLSSQRPPIPNFCGTMSLYRLRYTLPLGRMYASGTSRLHSKSLHESHNGSRFVRPQRLSLCVQIFWAGRPGIK